MKTHLITQILRKTQKNKSISDERLIYTMSIEMDGNPNIINCIHLKAKVRLQKGHVLPGWFSRLLR